MKLIQKYRGYQIKQYTKHDTIPDYKIGEYVVVTPGGVEDWEGENINECKQFIDGKKGTSPAIKLAHNEKKLIILLCHQKINDLQGYEACRAKEVYLENLKDIILKLGGTIENKV